MFIVALFLISPNWEQFKYSSTGNIHSYKGILFCNNNEQTTNICNTMDESQKYLAK